MSRNPRWGVVAASALLIVVLAGCAQIPADVDGTVDRLAEGGSLRVGVTANPPWTETTGDEPSGTEVDLVEAFAAEHGADIEWSEGSEAVLAEALRAGSLDVAIGGFVDTSPWTDKAAFTDIYTEVTGPGGVTEKHIMFTRPGENRLLVMLEVFLRENGAAS